MEEGQKITLIANDNTKHFIDSTSAKRSRFICDLLVDFSDENNEIKIAEANGGALQQIAEYLIHYKDTEPKAIHKPLQMEDKLSTLTDPWDIEFLEKNKDLQRLQDLIVASDYLGITQLHELLCAHIACLMKDLGTAEKIIKHFGIEEDMTEDEMRQLEKEELVALKKKNEDDRIRKKVEDEGNKKLQDNKEIAEEKYEKSNK